MARHAVPLRDRRGQVLFIDARKLGRMVDRTHRELTDDDIKRIADTYRAWRGTVGAGPRACPDPGQPQGVVPTYRDIPGFCRSVTIDDVRQHGHVPTPGRYVGAEVQEDDGEPFDEKMRHLVTQLHEQQAEAAALDAAIARNLEELGYGS